MKLTTYLTFSGNAGEAIKLYEKAFGAKILGLMHFGDMPSSPGMPPIPEEIKGLVLQALLDFGSAQIRVSDTMPGNTVLAGNNVSIAVTLDTIEQVNAVWNVLVNGGTINMPLQKTFFSPCYGDLTDRYGVSWKLMAEKE